MVKSVKNIFLTIYSYIIGRVIVRESSEINPVLEVVHMNGKYLLNAENANYSWGTLKKVFEVAFRKLNIKNREIHEVLILGFGAGSVASILTDHYKMNCAITGVEKDKKVIEIADRYFNINRFKKLNIIYDDAFNFLKKNTEKFDLIIVDVYIDNSVPQQCESNDFLQYIKLSLSNNAMVIFNKMYFDKKSEKSAKELYDRFSNVMGDASYLKVHRHHTNMMIYYEHHEVL
jgi:spermidine synthase